MKKKSRVIKFSTDYHGETTPDFWLSKSPEERMEAVEVIREQYYAMLGYNKTPRIKKIIKISPVAGR